MSRSGRLALGAAVGPCLAVALALPLPLPSGAHAQPPAEAATALAGAAEPGPAARRVLRAAERMITRRRIVRGSCYDYVQAVFRAARVTARERVFTASREGPFADPDLFVPGDWLYLVNRPDTDPVGTHSVVFVEWTDREQLLARVVSYPGGEQRRPGGYATYELSRVYRVQRPRE